jgi:hypothetical protein
MVRGIFEFILAAVLVFVLFLSNPNESDFMSGYFVPKATGQPSASGRSILVQPLRPENSTASDGTSDGIGNINDLAREATETARDVADDFVSRVEGANSEIVRATAANLLQGQVPIERRNWFVASIFTVPRAGRDIMVLGIADRFITLSE